MKNKKFTLLIYFLFVLAVVGFTGCAKTKLTSDADRAFEDYTLQLFRSDVACDTLSLHYTLENPEVYQIEEPPATFGRITADNTGAVAALENVIASLSQFPYRSLSRKNRITYDILTSYLDTQINLAPYALYEEPLGKTSGIQSQLPILLSEYRLQDESDVQTYLDLLTDFSDYFDSIAQFEREKSKAGLFMSDTNAQQIIAQCQAFLSMGDDNYLITTFKERVNALDGISKKSRKTYLRKNETLIKTVVYPAYQDLITTLKELKGSGKNPYGLCYLPKGREYYHLLVARQTGSSRSVSELENLIHSQMADDILSMQQIVHDNPKLAERDSASFAMKPTQILSDLKEGIATHFPAPPEVEVEIKYVPEPLEEYLSPAFYLIPAIDSSTPNVIYINRRHQSSDIYQFTTLAHEGYPGHLYQTTYFAATNPSPIRSLLNFGGYTEGWATYAEMCAYSLSPLDQDVATLLQKNASLLLGIYSACDIGIHEHGWDYDNAAEFLAQYQIVDATLVKEIYDLIIDNPANYLKYYIGYLEFLKLKKEAILNASDDFSQTKFHKAILEIGPAPFSVLRKYLFS